MKNKLKIWLIVATSIFGSLTILSLPMVIMSPMMFDAPGSTNNKALLAAFYSLISFPIIVLITIIVAWVLFRNNKLKTSLIISLIPLINLSIFILGMLLW